MIRQRAVREHHDEAFGISRVVDGPSDRQLAVAP
jgi:hypothetical protein